MRCNVCHRQRSANAACSLLSVPVMLLIQLRFSFNHTPSNDPSYRITLDLDLRPGRYHGGLLAIHDVPICPTQEPKNLNRSRRAAGKSETALAGEERGSYVRRARKAAARGLTENLCEWVHLQDPHALRYRLDENYTRCKMSRQERTNMVP
jgi:hypothetical protein